MKLPDGTAKGNWGLPWAAKAQRPRPIAYGVVSAGHLDKGRVACVVRRLLGLRTLYTLYMLTMSWYRPGWHYANGPPRSSIIIHQHTNHIHTGGNSIVLMPFTAAGIMYTALTNESGITCTLVSTNGKFVLLFVA